MRPKRIQWTYLGREHAEWTGMLPGEFPPVRFVLEKLSHDQYRVRCNLDGVPDQPCTGLDKARILAQQLYNTYAFSLFEQLGEGPLHPAAPNPPNHHHESP